MGAFLVATCASAIGSLFTSSASFAVTGFAACAVVTMPMLRRCYQLLSPWTLFAVIVYVACGLRGLVVAIGWNGGLLSNRDFFLLEHPASFFWWPSVLYVIALALVAATYALVTSRREHSGRESQRRRSRVDLGGLRHFHGHVPVVVAALASLGFLGFAWYVHDSGGLATLSSFSAKRSYTGGVDLSAGYSSHGAPRALNAFSAAAFWIYLVYVLRKPTTRLVSLRSLVALALFFNAILLPVYGSTRTDVGLIVLSAMAIFLAMQPSPRQRWLAVRNAAMVALVLLASMTFARLHAWNTERAQLSVHGIAGPIGDVLIWNRNHGDMYTSSLIIHAVPGQLPYAHGKTIATWFVAPIPRSMWSDKPRISPGPEIGQVIYGNGRSGVPPGFVGEMYWNFGLGGVLVGSALLGSLMGWVERRVRRLPSTEPAGILAAATISFPLGAYVVESGLGGGIFQLVLRTVPLVMGYVLCTAWFASRRWGKAVTVAAAVPVLLVAVLQFGRPSHNSAQQPIRPAAPSIPGGLAPSPHPFLSNREVSRWHVTRQRNAGPSTLFHCVDPRAWEADQVQQATYVEADPEAQHHRLETRVNEFVLQYADIRTAHQALHGAMRELNNCPRTANVVDHNSNIHRNSDSSWDWGEAFWSQRTWFRRGHHTGPIAIYALRAARVRNVLVVVEDTGIPVARPRSTLSQAVRHALPQYRE